MNATSTTDAKIPAPRLIFQRSIFRSRDFAAMEHEYTLRTFVAIGPWMMRKRMGTVIAPNTVATSRDGSALLLMLAMLAPSAPSQTVGMKTPSDVDQKTLLVLTLGLTNRV